MTKAIIVAALPLALTAGSTAAVQSFSDRAAWLAAVGPLSATEDFSGFTQDTEFRSGPVALAGGMSMGQTGANTAAFRNFIDVPPLQFTDNNGTAHASSFVNGDDSPGVATGILISLTTNARAWGADFWGARSGEFLAVEVLGIGGSVLATIEPSNVSGQFAGFFGDAGEQFTAIRFRNVNITPGSGGEGFGMDNFAISFIPAPGAASLLGIAALAGLRRRR